MLPWKSTQRLYSLACVVGLAAIGCAGAAAPQPAAPAAVASPPSPRSLREIAETLLPPPHPGSKLCPRIASEDDLLFPEVLVRAEGVSTKNLRAWVDTLASPTLEGRASGSVQEKRAAVLLAAYLSVLEWAPVAADGDYCQHFGEDVIPDQNVVARLAPRGGAKRTIVLGAHYDGQGHCGKNGEICPSADDNASGVAALLEVARILTIRFSALKVEVVIAFFGGEERGIVGSRYFVDHPPIAMDRVSRMVNLDMVGRPFLDGQTALRFLLANPVDTVGYVVGDRDAAASRALIQDVGERLGTRVIGVPESLLRRSGFTSDSVPFGQLVPTLFLSTSIHDDYHQPGDVAAKVDIDQISRAVGLVLGIVDAG